MDTVFALERPAEPPELSMFLAGPSPRGNGEYNWRSPEALDYLERVSFCGTVYVPLPRDGVYHDEYDKPAQGNWELDYLESCDAIALWMPRNMVTLPGFTSNVEYGLFARSGKLVLGYPPEAEKVSYLHVVAERYGVPICHTLEETLNKTMWLADTRARGKTA